MLISRKIIFSSTIIAILAALAAFMGWKKTQPIQQHLVEKLRHTSEEIQFLNNIKTKASEINSEIQSNVKAINNNTIENLDQYFEKARLLDIKVKALNVQIQAFKAFNQTSDSETRIERLLHQSEILREQTRILIPNKNTLASSTIALEAGQRAKNTFTEIESLITTISTHRFSLINAEGELVKDQISKLNFWIILIGSLTFLMAIVFGQVIAHNLSQEIRTLREVSKQANQGGYSVKAGSNSNDEFGKPGQTFDEMVKSLEQAKTIKT